MEVSLKIKTFVFIGENIYIKYSLVKGNTREKRI
jgi:hypothetical protein